MQKVHWKVRTGCAIVGTLTGFGAALRRRRRPRSPNEPNEPYEPRDLYEYADAKEPVLECDVPKLLAEDSLCNDLLEPSSP